MLGRIDNKTKTKFIVFLLIAAVLAAFAILYAPRVIGVLRDIETVRNAILSWGIRAYGAYTLILAAHVLLVVVPGEIFIICGGYAFGVPGCFFLSILGIMLGSSAAFYISKSLGYGFVSKIVPREKTEALETLLNSAKGTAGLLILCLIPLLPKDLLMYAAGLTPVKPLRLLFIYGITRIPGILLCASLGAQTRGGGTEGFLITAIALAALVMTGAVLQKRYGARGPERTELNS